ncbi:uncharacterized protein LOC124448858 [Xenia sp. Carnegie-2017]|uniref:uncharacterized protein LOC124448858 n=1 Tax=Xenia sp. Carnegie-2017 TaxID=2897299 RepID=UPI001F0474C8|nr:uncharacterized protein LOC124448858 [Xenia sp. Carnegie-2017]
MWNRFTPVSSGRSSSYSNLSNLPEENPSPITTAVFESSINGLSNETNQTMEESPLDCSSATTEVTSLSEMVTLGPNLVVKKHVLKRIIAKKVGSYVSNLMGETLSLEHMATHSYKGQKGKNGQVKPRLYPTYNTSLIQHATSVKYSNMPRQIIEEDVV